MNSLAKYIVASVCALAHGASFAYCTFTGDWEKDQACRDMQQQKRELQEQKQDMQRMRAEIQRMNQEMRNQKAETDILVMEADPRFQQLRQLNPECANALQVYRIKVAELGGNQNSGLLGMIGNHSRNKKLRTYERAMYRTCKMEDPVCAEAKAERDALGYSASDRNRRKADRAVSEKCN